MNWLDINDSALQLDDAGAAVRGSAHRCDAHALWACLSGFDGYLQTDDPASESLMVSVLVELDPGATPAERLFLRALLRPPGAYGLDENFWTGILRSQDLAQLFLAPRIVRWRIGLPVVEDTDPRGVVALEPVANVGLKVLIGTIDHGIAMAHAAFRFPRGGTVPRIFRFWDQDPSRLERNVEGHWKPVRGLGYGGELRGAALQALLGSESDEEEIYRRLQYEPALTRVSHGTHVLDLAAGLPSPLTPPDLRWQPGAAWDWSGRASMANIVAVQLPYRPAKDTSGSALCVNVLDALHYIERCASNTIKRVVVNLSDGAYGGPHDGNSLLERAIDAFLEANQRVQLVLAAGNAHEDRAHGRVDALAKGTSRTLRWRVLPDDPTVSFLEVWFDRKLSAGDIELTLGGPGNLPPITVPLGESKFLVGTRGMVGAVISQLDSPNAAGRSMYLVVLAATRRRSGVRPEAPHGVWTLDIRNAAAEATVAVDAWIERDNPALNDRGPRRQSYFEDNICSPAYVSGKRTLGSLAGAELPIVVGGHYQRNVAFSGCDPSAPTRVARYSSRGPGRKGAICGPDLTAPSDMSPVAHGLHGGANHSGATFRMDGTSVAAPIVTRRVANLFFQDINAPVKERLVPAPAPDPGCSGERAQAEPGKEPLPPDVQ